jgi:hypothetical protein
MSKYDNIANKSKPSKKPDPQSVKTAGLRIIKVRSTFFTTNDDKDREDGISETIFLGTQVLASNQDHGKGLVYRNNTPDYGEEFTVNVDASECSKMRYNMRMSTDQKWHVTVKTYAWYSDGTEKQVGEANFEYGGNHREDNVFFLTC